MTAETVKIDTPDSRATSEILAALPAFGCLVRFGEDTITNGRYQGHDVFSKRLALRLNRDSGAKSHGPNCPGRDTRQRTAEGCVELGQMSRILQSQGHPQYRSG